MKFSLGHLAYCTNIHPAETWSETMEVLRNHALEVRRRLGRDGPYALGLRLSSVAATELLSGDELAKFGTWLEETNAYVFTINGFPYGGFHGQRVKEKVFQPDWTTPERIEYTKNLFRILAAITPPGESASVSTVPGSHKTFEADESLILSNLRDFGMWLDNLAEETGIDLHLGLEPEPIGHIENTEETIRFFEKLHRGAQSSSLAKRIGVNYDACHFAIEFDDAEESLDRLHEAGIRLSKIHLSNALALNPGNANALAALRAFEEPVYFHQVIARNDSGELVRFVDLPDFLESSREGLVDARVHFHIPLDVASPAPLESTIREVSKVISWCARNPGACDHYEIETYTWAVLPQEMRRTVEEQIASEYEWVFTKA